MSDTEATHAPIDSGVPAFARDFSVDGRVVIVSGSGQGIGRELARQFGAAGAIAIVADLNQAKADAVAAEIQSAGGRAMPLTVDIASRESTDAMAAAVKDKYGRIDALINNAGIFATLNKRAFDQIPAAEWDLVLKVNVTGIFNSVCSVAQTMRDQGYGRIVNLSSDSVHKGTVNYLHYVTSKAAVIGMTNSLSRELGPYGITVNAIRPGSVATEVDRTHNPTVEVRQRNANLQCIPRGMMPTDLVGLAMFLTTNASAFITGQTIACDGGYTHSF